MHIPKNRPNVPLGIPNNHNHDNPVMTK